MAAVERIAGTDARVVEWTNRQTSLGVGDEQGPPRLAARDPAEREGLTTGFARSKLDRTRSPCEDRRIDGSDPRPKEP
jgi:hypothetical protein